MVIMGDDFKTIDGTCVRDYIHVSDLVAAHLLGNSGVRGYAYRGTRVCISGVRGYEYPGYKGMNIGYEGMNIRGTMV